MTRKREAGRSSTGDVICDDMLRHVARWLRIFGVPTELGRDDDEILKKALEGDMILLTRDRALWERARALGVKAFLPGDLLEALAQVFRALSKRPNFPEGSLCPICGHPLLWVSPDYWRCSKCGHLFWKGSHFPRIMEVLKALREKLGR